MSRWTCLAPWEFEFPFPGSLTSTFLLDFQADLAEDQAQREGGEVRPNTTYLEPYATHPAPYTLHPTPYSCMNSVLYVVHIQ